MTAAHTEVPEALRGKRQLGEGESFAFSCHPGVPCFNRCCADVNIILTPLDVLRLARRLDLPTRAFLDRHTLTPITKELHLPVVMLRMRDDQRKSCPFVGEQGCTVYEDRPWACRMYPVGMGIPPARAGIEPAPVYFLFEDDFCEGRCGDHRFTAEQWRADQGVDERDAIETGYRAIVSHPWFIGGRTLDPKRMEMFFTAAYDLDSFRSFIFETSFLDRFELENELVERLRTNDDALLDFSWRWLRFALFAEPTLTARPSAPAQRRTP